MQKLPMVLWIGSLLALACCAGWGAFELPDRVPSHFDAAGTPDRWSDRVSFLVQWLGLIALVNAIPAALILCIHRLPARWLAVPHRSYWLQDEARSDRLYAVLRQTLALVSIPANVIFGITFYSIALFALQDQLWLPPPLVMIATSVLTGLLPLGYLLLRLRVPPSSSTLTCEQS